MADDQPETTILFSLGEGAETLTVQGTLGEVETALGAAHGNPGGFAHLKDVKGRPVLVNAAVIKFIRERVKGADRVQFL